MNAKTIAEKMFLMRGMFFDTKVGQELHVAKIESLILEAMEQIKKEAIENFLSGSRTYTTDDWKETRDRLKETKLAAYEECAEIAEEHNGCVDDRCFKSNCPVTIANELRAKAKELK